MAVHGGASQERPWSDLPGDLLSAIYLRSGSAYERARFAAVCSPWRAAAAWHPRLPALPLLLPSTGDGDRDREARAYSLEDGRALRVPLPWFPWGNRLVGSYEGGWIAAVSGSGGLLVVNMFSGVRAARLSVSINFIRKIVFSKDPSSDGCVMVAMTSAGIALRKVACRGSGWTTWCNPNNRYEDLLDIVFHNGDFYGITFGALVVFQLGVNKEDSLMAIRDFRIDVAMRFYMTGLSSTVKYIFELHGKLALAVEVYDCNECHFFRVFELADEYTMTTHKYVWAEVTSLGDHALFLGRANCKATHSIAGQRGGVDGNRIYYSKEHTYLHDNNSNNMVCLASFEIGTCTMHCWESQSKHHLERIASRGYYYRKDRDGANGCLWLWPPNF